MRYTPCPAASTANGMLGLIAPLAAGALNAHFRGVEAMRQAREDHASHIINAQLDAALDHAEQLARYIELQAEEISRLRAENDNLDRVAKRHFIRARELQKRVRHAG